MSTQPGGPPNKVSFVETKHLNPQEVADQLSILWQQGYQGPYVSVGTVIYVAGYEEKKD